MQHQKQETTDQAARRRRMAVLAQAPIEKIVELWSATGLDPAVELLRGPESGMIALRGRIGGTGQPFQVGEVSATRVTVRIGGHVGHAMIVGRDVRHAKLAAVIDGLSEDAELGMRLEAEIIAPLEAGIAAADATRAAETAATRVNFFTMVRGED